MRLLHEDEFSCALHLLESKNKTLTLRYSDIQYSSDYFGARYVGFNNAFGFLLNLNKNKLIDIKSSKINWDSFFSDTLLKKYSELVKNGHIEEAKQLAISMEVEMLNETLKEQETLNQTIEIINKVLDKRDIDMESSFAEDLYEAILLSIEVEDELSNYLQKYLEEFCNDKLEKPQSPKEDWNKIRYFEQDFYRYKKQRQIFIDAIKNKLETQPPNKIKIYSSDIPREHINEAELFTCLEKEGLINHENYEYGGFGKDDKPHWLLDVNEKMIEGIPSDKEIKLNLSFNPHGFMDLKDQDSNEYKIRVQGQVQKEVLREIFRNPQQVYSEWSLYDISNALGSQDVDKKAVKNAIYQFNKKVKLKIPEIDNLFELTEHTARLNPKYIKR